MSEVLEVATSDRTKPPTTSELIKKFGAGSPADILRYLNLLIYGDPGAGKTWLCGTAADHKLTGPILFFDVEGGTTTIRHRSDVSVVRVKKYADLWNPIAEMSAMPEIPFGTVIVDSATELQKLDMGNIMKDVYMKDRSRDIDVPSVREWGKSSNRIRTVIRRLRDMECNTVVTALAQTKREADGSVATLPDLPGKLAHDVSGFYDVVGYLYVNVEQEGDTRTVERRMLCQPTRRFMAKDRTSALGQVVVNPTFPKLWELITDTHSNSKGTK